MNYIFYHPLPCQLVSTIKSDLIARYSATSGAKVRLWQLYLFIQSLQPLFHNLKFCGFVGEFCP